MKLGKVRTGFRLAQTLTFIAGAEVTVDEGRTSTYVGKWASVLVAVTKDSTAEMLMPFDEALALGIIEDGEATHKQFLLRSFSA